MQNGTASGKPHIQRMASPDMRLFVRQDFGSALLHIDAGDDNIFHPTERWDCPVGHDKPRPILQQGHLARTDQADDLQME